MRVIAGKYRGRSLHSLRGMDIRPTSDRLRETLFDVLCAGDPSAVEQTVWLDLYAGTGAVGIEALSRGAGTVSFVEASARAVELIRRNLDSLLIESGCQLVKSEVAPALRRLEQNGVVCDFVFLDPPYELQRAYHQTLEGLAHSRLLHPGSVVVAEHQKRFDPGDGSAPLERYRKLVQGDAALSFYRMGPEVVGQFEIPPRGLGLNRHVSFRRSSRAERGT